MKRQNEAGVYRREGARDMMSAGYGLLGKSGRMARLLAGALLVALALMFVAGSAGASPCTACDDGGGGGGGETIAPTVTGVSPTENATNVPRSQNVTATFSESMESTTITTSTFTLLRQGTTTPVAATVSYDSASKTATLNPNADLDSTATYTATVTSGAKDLAGNGLDQDSATAGEQPKSWSFRVADTTPPNISGLSPNSGVQRGTITLSVSASDNSGSVSRVEFRLRGALVATDDTAPYSRSLDTASFSDGAATIRATAFDASGNSSFVESNVTIDNTAPTLTITSGPDGQAFSPGTTQTWNFSASDATSGIQSVQCSVVETGDPQNFGPCSGGNVSHSVTNLPVGSYTMSVRATDNAGNVSAPITRSFSIVPALRITDTRVVEKTTNARFIVRLSATSQQSITVNYATANGSAKAPADYATRRGTLTFSPGQTAKAIAVPIRSDRRNERNEVFFVRLSGQTNATIADGSARGTIIDND